MNENEKVEVIKMIEKAYNELENLKKLLVEITKKIDK